MEEIKTVIEKIERMKTDLNELHLQLPNLQTTSEKVISVAQETLASTEEMLQKVKNKLKKWKALTKSASNYRNSLIRSRN